MKKFFYVAVSLAVGIGFIKGCEAYKKRGDFSFVTDPVSKLLQTSDQEEKTTYPVPVYVVPEESPIQLVNLENTPKYEASMPVDFTNFVNSEVYNHLNNACIYFNNLYLNGEVSSQLRNRGITLSQAEAEYIDSSMHITYGLIYNYVTSYENNDLNNCYKVGKEIINNKGVDKSFLYDVLVSRRLPVECQSGINFQDSYGIYDEYGNIKLKDGRRLRLIGGTDDVISADDNYFDDYNRLVQRSMWYEKLPNILYNDYSYIHNTGGDNGICYVFNQTTVERACSNEWNSIKKSGQSLYGFDVDTTNILWDPNNVVYVYEDINGQHYPLDSMSNARVDHLFDVQDAMILKEGDVYFLDNYIKNMRSYEAVSQYTK